MDLDHSDSVNSDPDRESADTAPNLSRKDLNTPQKHAVRREEGREGR
jgi:hypothetical protein